MIARPAAGVGTCTGLQGHRNVDSSLRTLNLVLDATGFLLNTFSAKYMLCLQHCQGRRLPLESDGHPL